MTEREGLAWAQRAREAGSQVSQPGFRTWGRPLWCLHVSDLGFDSKEEALPELVSKSHLLAGGGDGGEGVGGEEDGGEGMDGEKPELLTVGEKVIEIVVPFSLSGSAVSTIWDSQPVAWLARRLLQSHCPRGSPSRAM